MCTTESGLMTFLTEEDRSYGETNPFTKESWSTEENKDLENTHSLMEATTKAISKIICSVVKECLCFPMEIIMTESGARGKCKDMECLNGMMVANTKESITTI